MFKNISIAILFLLLSVKQTTAQNLDVNILKNINPRNPDSWYEIQVSASVYWVSGIAALGPLAGGLISGNKQMRHMGGELFIAIATDLIVSEGLKYAINRERPGDKYPGVIFPRTVTHGRSFPSTHTSLAFATATTLAIEYKKWYVTAPAYVWAGFVGYSRMYLGKHYPSDVACGALIGAGSSYFSYWLNKKLFGKRYSTTSSVF